MKNFLMGTSALAGIVLAGSAMAADLPRRAAPPVFTPVPVFTWTGFYFGFNAGYAFDANDRRDSSVTITDSTIAFIPGAGPAGPFPVITFDDRSREGFSGGGQIGYNYQFTPGNGVVVGFEADAQYLDFGRQRDRFAISPANAAVNGNVVFFDPRATGGLDFFGTVRGRLGYAFDRVLFYGTGGFAYASGGDERRFGVGRDDDFRTGYAVGGGIEYALPTDSFLNFFRSSAVTLKVEGLYVDLERPRSGGVFAFNTVTNTPFTVANFSDRRSDAFAVVRAGLNFKFGSF